MSEAASHEFDHEQFDRALTVLEDEQRAMQLSPRQRLSLRLYSWSMAGFIGFLIALIAYLASQNRLNKDLSGHENIVIGLLALAVIVCLGCAVVSLILNLKLVWQIVRSRIQFRRMGFSTGSEALWKAHQKKRPWAALLEKMFFVLGSVVLLVGLIALPVAISTHDHPAYAVVILGFSLLVFMFYFLRSGKARLDMMSARLADLTRLKESMTRLATAAGKSGDGRVALPGELIEKYSQVETDQIARSRAAAIANSLRASKQEYSILSSQQVRHAKSGLAADERAKVEAALDGLMKAPLPASAVSDSDTGLMRVPVEGTGLELSYSVDDASSQLRVVSLQSASVGSASNA